MHIYYLGAPLISCMVYIWARKNPHIHLSFLGLVTFSARYLPYVMFGFSALVANRVPFRELLGILVGHVYYFLDDYWPSMGGPRILSRHYNRPAAPENPGIAPEDLPGARAEGPANRENIGAPAQDHAEADPLLPTI